MRIDTYRFKDLHFFSKLLSDYTNHTLDSRIHLPSHLGWDGIEQQLQTPYPLRIDRSQLRDVVFEQYRQIPVCENVRENINALASENTYCLVTAHQLSFMGGPLYYVIKIANAISLARKLNNLYPHKKFVPVYWMGSEDHDFEEVNHIYLFGKKVVWDTPQTGPVGRFNVENIDSAVQEVLEILGEDAPDDIQNIIRKAYSRDNVESASRELVNSLMGRYGLVIVNGDDKKLKESVKDIIQKELFEKVSTPLFEEQSKDLVESGYHAQATARAINLFHLGDTFRYRIEPQGDGFEINQQFWSKERMETEVREHPENFSPNVVLRPLFQQSVIPAIAFIGGGSEVAYWMQLPKIFNHFQVRYPVIIPRTSLLWITHPVYQKIEKLNLRVSDFFEEKELLKKEFVLQNSQFQPELNEEKKNIQTWMERVQEKVAQMDSTLGPAVGADAQKIQKILEQIEGKMMRSVKQKNEVSLRQIDSVYQSLFPDHTLQERHDNFLNFYSKYGASFIDNLVQYLNVIDQDFVVITDTESMSK